MVLSLLLPVLLKRIVPLVEVVSWTEILMFPAGEAMNPEREIVTGELANLFCVAALAKTVVPSVRIARKFAGPDVSVMVTVPVANQVPVVPCDTVGPTNTLAVLLRATSPLNEFVRAVFDKSAILRASTVIFLLVRTSKSTISRRSVEVVTLAPAKAE